MASRANRVDQIQLFLGVKKFVSVRKKRGASKIVGNSSGSRGKGDRDSSGGEGVGKALARQGNLEGPGA